MNAEPPCLCPLTAGPSSLRGDFQICPERPASGGPWHPKGSPCRGWAPGGPAKAARVLSLRDRTPWRDAGAAPEYGRLCEEQRDLQVWAAKPQRQGLLLLSWAWRGFLRLRSQRTGPCSVHGPTARPAGPPAAQEAGGGGVGQGMKAPGGRPRARTTGGPAAHPPHQHLRPRGLPRPLSQQDGRSSHLTSRGAESELQSKFLRTSGTSDSTHTRAGVSAWRS